MQNSTPVPASGAPIRYRVGTLRYTTFGVVTLFIWMLWGDFSFSMMELLIPNLLPLFLNMHSAPDWLIGVIVGSVPAALNLVINPIVSTRSDRTRTRWGRRIPYLIFATPFVTLFLVLLGWSDSIGSWIHGALLPGGSPMTAATTIIAVIAVLAVGFQFFNMFVFSIFYYIFADVVPKELMGRFMSLFRMVGSVAGFIFHRYIVGYAETHMAWIFTLVALIYFFAFLSMCFFVKEGEYPPPEPRKGNAVATYLRECFSLSFYRWFFLGVACNEASTVCRTTFNLLFARNTLGLEVAQYGEIMSINTIISFCLLIPLGFLIDKFHALRTYMAGAVLILAANIFGFFFVRDYTTFFIVSATLAVVYVVQVASKLPMFVSLLPREKYGQYSSANAIVVSIMLILANAGGGIFIGTFGYRFIYVWDFAFTTLGLVALVILYRAWQRRGGRASYTPPVVAGE